MRSRMARKSALLRRSHPARAMEKHPGTFPTVRHRRVAARPCCAGAKSQPYSYVPAVSAGKDGSTLALRTPVNFSMSERSSEVKAEVVRDVTPRSL